MTATVDQSIQGKTMLLEGLQGLCHNPEAGEANPFTGSFVQFTSLSCAEVRWSLENESGLLKTQLVIPIVAIVINVVLVLDHINKAPDI